MRVTRLLAKITPVPTRDVVPVSSLVYRTRYTVPRKMTLSRHFDKVDEHNRFLSLELLLQRLSGYVGRRQYKMQCNLEAYLPRLKERGVDWHDLKQLQPDELRELMRDELGMTHAERAVLLSVLEVRVCGVLCRTSTRHSTVLCMRHGVAEHGWRCGRAGHTCDVYFEGKPCANTALWRFATQPQQGQHQQQHTQQQEQQSAHAPSSSLSRDAADAQDRDDSLAYRSTMRVAERDGVRVEVRSEPNFAVVGRTHHGDLHPRMWRTPEHAVFAVTCVGYEFRVHPRDPRAAPQIEAAAAEWELHAAVTQQVLCEMLEMHAVERAPQPLSLVPGEMGRPDVPQSYSSSFTCTIRQQRPSSSASTATATTTTTPHRDGDVDAGDDSATVREADVVVEQRMCDVRGNERPWFATPLRQRFCGGVPACLPFAPTLVIHSRFHQLTRSYVDEDVMRQLVQPVMDVSCYVHPRACFDWGSEEQEQHCIRQVLDYAKRMPFALPYNLYFRVDTTRALRRHPHEEEVMQQRLASKAHWYDLRRFRAVHMRHQSKSKSDHDDDADGDDNAREGDDDDDAMDASDDNGASYEVEVVEEADDEATRPRT